MAVTLIRRASICQFIALLIMCAVLFFGMTVHAIEWHTANQITVAWDAVMTSIEGTTIPTEQVSYEVFVYEEGTTLEMSMGTVADTTFTLTLPHEGKWYWGVKAIRTVGGVIVGESRTVWSIEPAYDHGIQYWAAPNEPAGLQTP